MENALVLINQHGRRHVSCKAAILSTTLLIIFLLRMGLICSYYTVKCMNVNTRN